MKKALLTVLLGTYDVGSSLYALRLFRKTLLPMVWREVDESVRSHLSFEVSAVSLKQQRYYVNLPLATTKAVNVNMLPINTRDKKSLPKELSQYWELIQTCVGNTEDAPEIAYLTVHESFVEKGGLQRRGGLHIETPGTVEDTELGEKYSVGWGVGERRRNRLYGGIFFGSNMTSSCAIWPNVLVVNPHEPGVVGAGGACEYLREYLGPPRLMPAGEIFWMTDRTPHEALPQIEKGWRQFFRLVVGKVSVWYSKHNTANPRCPLPSDVKVIHEDKFVAMGIDK